MLRVLLGTENVTTRLESGWRFSNVDPGGYESCEFTINEDMDIRRGTHIRIELGGELAWEGRASEVTRKIDRDKITTVLVGEGYGALVKENYQSELYISRNLSDWQDMSVPRRLLATTFNTASWSVGRNDAGSPGFYSVTSISGSGAGNPQTAELIFDAGPNNLVGQVRIGSVYLVWPSASPTGWNNSTVGLFFNIESWTSDNPNTGIPGDSTYWAIMQADPPPAAPIPPFGTGAVRTYLRLNAAGTLRVTPDGRDIQAEWSNTGGNAGGHSDNHSWPLPQPMRFVALQWGMHSALATTDPNADRGCLFTNISLIGNHGLPLRPGPDSTTATDGFYASDIITDVIQKVPGVKPGTIQLSSGYTIADFAYPFPVRAEQMISDAASFNGWHWGTWGDPSVMHSKSPTFYFMERPRNPTCWITRADTTGLDISERITDLFNEANIIWNDPLGRIQQITRTLEVPELDEQGLTRPMYIDLGMSNLGSATTLGDLILELSNQAGRGAGKAELTGNVHTTGGAKPAPLLKAGLDRLKITDLPVHGPTVMGADIDLRTAFRVARVETTVNADGPVTSVDLDAGANLIEVLQARTNLAQNLSLGQLLATTTRQSGTGGSQSAITIQG